MCSFKINTYSATTQKQYADLFHGDNFQANCGFFYISNKSRECVCVLGVGEISESPEDEKLGFTSRIKFSLSLALSPWVCVCVKLQI